MGFDEFVRRVRIPRASAHTRAHTQVNHKKYGLGTYAVEADAAAARDVVARVLGRPLNFKKTRKITGQRSKSADKLVADAVKAANACVLGNSMTFVFSCKQVAKIVTTTFLCPETPS